MHKYNKPFRSIHEQRAMLEERGMVITDQQKAEECLHRVGYYRLSAYWYPFRRFDAASGERENTFLPGTSFETVFALYVFDKKLRLLFLDALERIEIALRTDVALQLGRYGALGYRDAANFDRKFSVHVNPKNGVVPHLDWLMRFDRKAAQSKEQFATHFRRKYSGDPFPICVAVELLDFGPLSHLVAGLKTADQRAIAKRYGVPRPELLESWVRTLNFVRNVCAHHARLWNKPLKDYPKMPRAGEMSEFDHLLEAEDVGRLYTAACIAQHFMKRINPSSSWRDRLVELTAGFPANGDLSLLAAGFLEAWHDNELWN